MLELFFIGLLASTVLAADLEVPSSVANRSIAIKGQLYCGTKPYEGAKIRLYRTYQKDLLDDLSQLLDSKQTYITGMFELEGSTDKFPRTQTEIDPFVTIHHACDQEERITANKGYKRWAVQIPEDYVTLGSKARKTYDFGKINLQLQYPGEIQDKAFKFND